MQSFGLRACSRNWPHAANISRGRLRTTALSMSSIDAGVPAPIVSPSEIS